MKIILNVAVYFIYSVLALNPSINKDVLSFRHNSLKVNKPNTSNCTPSKNEITPKIYAVIVGVADYAHIKDLTYADDDAILYYNFLKSRAGGALPQNQIELLINNQATKENILWSMDRVFSKATSNDFIVFYFSGHGAQGFFCPNDFNANRNALLHTEIKSIFKKYSTRYKLFIADACHSGSIRSQTTNKSSQASYKSFTDDRQSVAIMVSSKTQEYSIEHAGVRQGIFSYFLIKGLRGEADLNKDKIIFVGELFLYVQNRVKEVSKNKQNPILYGRKIEKMPVGVW